MIMHAEMIQKQWHILEFSDSQDSDARKKVKDLIRQLTSKNLELSVEIKFGDIKPLVNENWES